MKFGVLISGRGSNMVALAEACASPDHPADIAVVVANDADAPGLRKAAEIGIPTDVVDHRDYPGRESFEEALLPVLAARDVEAVALAGFMRLLSSRFLSAFPERVLNIHPSLLPAFPGLDAHEQALEHGVRWSGCTVHMVTEEMDAGPIVLQAAVPVRQDDDVDSLSARILTQEHRIYPEAVRLLAQGRVQVQGRRVKIDGLEGSYAYEE